MALWPNAWRNNLPWAGQAQANTNVLDIHGVIFPRVETKIDEMQAGGWQLVRGVYDFAVSTGAQAEYDIFDVTGDVLVQVIGVGKTAVTDAAGASRLQVGVTGDTDALLAQIEGPHLTIGDIWHDATPTTKAEKFDLYGAHSAVITGGQDIVMEISGADITAGVIHFYCFYKPLSADGHVAPA